MSYDILIIGGDSAIGSALYKYFRFKLRLNVAKTSRRSEKIQKDVFQFDLFSHSNLWELPTAKYVLIAAAITNIARCEENLQESQAINTKAPINIAKWCNDHNSKVVFLSSIAVFGNDIGKKSKLKFPDPSTAYGYQKLTAERGIAEANRNHLIIRMGKILPQTFPLFESWIADLQLNRPIKPFSELFVAPLHEFMVTNLISRLINSKIFGETFNLTAKDSLAYSEIARIIAEYLNFDKNLVRAVSSSKDSLLWKPAIAHMDCTKITQLLEVELPLTKDVVVEYLNLRNT